VALLRSAGAHEAGDLVEAATQLHRMVATEFFQRTLPTLAPDNTLRIASEVIKPAMYRNDDDKPISTSQARAPVASKYLVSPTTVIGYENKLLWELAGLVYRNVPRTARSERISPSARTSDAQRRLARRAQRQLYQFHEHWEGDNWGTRYRPEHGPTDELLALAWFLTFIDSLLKEIDEGHEGPILVLNIEPHDDYLDYGQFGIKSSPDFSDDGETDYLIWSLMEHTDENWIAGDTLIQLCRVTRGIERTDTQELKRRIGSISVGKAAIKQWDRLCRCFDECEGECFGARFYEHIYLILDALTASLDYGSRSEARRQMEIRQAEIDSQEQQIRDLQSRRNRLTAGDPTKQVKGDPSGASEAQHKSLVVGDKSREELIAMAQAIVPTPKKRPLGLPHPDIINSILLTALRDGDE
jgi:hypothetical protein